MPKNTFRVFCLFLLWVSGSSLFAIDPVFQKSGSAIRGYDPVAYFTEGRPVKGDKAITIEWNQATWHFATQQNKEMFQQNPEKYAPQYGGYCAYAVSQGKTAKTEPELWTVHNDKLYLNYSKGVMKKWLKDKDGYISQADQNWPGILEGK